MNIEHIIYFNLALIVAMLSPGPAFFLSIQTTLRAGRSAGICLGVGLALMASVWTGSALLGLETVFYLFPWAYTTVKTIGALYLVYIAVQIWRYSGDEINEKSEKHNKNAFWQGVLLNAINPKSIFFAASVLVIIFPPNMSFSENVLVVLNQFVLEIIFYACLAFSMSLETIRSGYLNLKLTIDRIASLVVGGLGLRLLLDRE